MELTTDEYNILATRHANSYEAAQLRDRLIAEGLYFCSVCKSIKEADAFRPLAKGRGGRETSCRRCQQKKNGSRRTGYIPTGRRFAENEARRHERDPEGCLESRRAAGRKSSAKKRAEHRAANPLPPKLTPSELRSNKRASKRRNFQKRKALGMSGRQANYMAPAPEFDESWNAIKR